MPKRRLTLACALAAVLAAAPVWAAAETPPTFNTDVATEREVYWGEQSWDEMFLPFMEYSIDKLDLSLETTSESDEDGQ